MWEARPLEDAHLEPYQVIDRIKTGTKSCDFYETDCVDFDLAKYYSNKIRDIIVTKAPGKSPDLDVNFHSDLPNYTNNFDLAFKCQKKGKIPLILPCDLVGSTACLAVAATSPTTPKCLFALGYCTTIDSVPITTDFWIMMNFQTEEPKEVERCCLDGGERHYVVGENDGSESFCV